MKIIQILILLISTICFSCDRTLDVDSNDIEYKRKEDSLNRVQFLAYTDKMEKMYASIKIPHTWYEVEKKNGKVEIKKSKDNLDIHQRMHIDISTGYQVSLMWHVENEKLKLFHIKSISDKKDSIIFNTTENDSNESFQWIFKFTADEKELGSWSIYNLGAKTLVLTGIYTSEKNENK